MSDRPYKLLTNVSVSEERWDVINQKMIYRVEYDEEILRQIIVEEDDEELDLNY